MSNTEKLIKQLNTNKEIRKQMEEQKEKKLNQPYEFNRLKTILLF